MKTILIIILALNLQACAFLDFLKKPDVSPPVAESAKVDPKLLEFCKLLTPVKVVEFSDVINAYSSLASQYSTCAAKQAAGIKVIKELGNIK